MHQKWTKKGFLFFEVLIGLVTFSIVCLIITWQRWEIIKQEKEALDRFQAISLARNMIEKIRIEKEFSLPNKQTKNKFTIISRQEPLSLSIEKNVSILENFKLIKVMVNWQSIRGARSVELVTGFNSS